MFGLATPDRSALAFCAQLSDYRAQDAAGDVEVVRHHVVEFLLIDFKCDGRQYGHSRLGLRYARQQGQGARHAVGPNFLISCPFATRLTSPSRTTNIASGAAFSL